MRSLCVLRTLTGTSLPECCKKNNRLSCYVFRPYNLFVSNTFSPFLRSATFRSLRLLSRYLQREFAALLQPPFWYLCWWSLLANCCLSNHSKSNNGLTDRWPKSRWARLQQRKLNKLYLSNFVQSKNGRIAPSSFLSFFHYPRRTWPQATWNPYNDTEEGIHETFTRWHFSIFCQIRFWQFCFCNFTLRTKFHTGKNNKVSP